MRRRVPPKSKILYVKPVHVVKADGMKTEILHLPGEEPPAWELCNCDMRFPKHLSNKNAMCRGFADEAVVAVKPEAEEDMATYPRIKLSENDRDVGGEGRNM